MQRKWLVGLIFFVVPALFYIGLLTRFTFNLFDSTYGWQVYNYYAMALADGRQTIAAEVIAGEGQYIDGKVYMYYGILPAILRTPMMLFVDLRYLPVSNLIVAAMLIVGQFAMQLAILRIFISNGRTTVFADRCILALVSFASWFMSGPLLIASTASFYHEPFAAAAMLVGIYTAMLATDLLVHKRRPAGGRLLVYALLAGLAVHARQTSAVGLYAVTLALLLPALDDLRHRTGPTLRAALRQAVIPLLVLFAFGASFLALTYLRSGSIGSGFSIANYGYWIIGNNRPRLAEIDAQAFNLVRVPASIVFNLFGGAELRENLICELGGGVTVNFGMPVRWAIFASVPLLFAAAGLLCVWRRFRDNDPLAWPIAAAGVGFLFIAIFIWSYVTAQYRYNAEVWPLVAWLMLIAMRDLDPTRLFGRWLVPTLISLAVLCTISVAYSVNIRAGLTKVATQNRGSLRIGVPLAPELAAAATAPGARDPQVIVIRKAFGPDPDLPTGWTVRPFDVLRSKC